MKKIFIDPPHPCPYISGKSAITLYEYNAYITHDEFERRLNSGWRKFGNILFKPICKECKDCRPIRVLVNCFNLSTNLKKIVKRNESFRVVIQKPIADIERVSLYNNYHLHKSISKKWPLSLIDSCDEYEFYFLNNKFTTYEISIINNDRIIGLILLDEVKNLLSAVYHFYDPNFQKFSIGTYLLIQSIFLARSVSKDFLHLGYFVLGSKDMMYKCRFKPAEILDENYIWLPFKEWLVKQKEKIANINIPFISLPCLD